LDPDAVGCTRSFELYSLLSAYGLVTKIVDNQFGDIDEMEDWKLELTIHRFLSEDGIMQRQMETILGVIR